MILGGQQATPKPWMALLRTGFDYLAGGGVLISENMILTAAHLTRDENSIIPRASTMRFDIESNAYAEKGIDFRVRKIFRHPEYKKHPELVSQILMLSKMILRYGWSKFWKIMATRHLNFQRCPGTWTQPL